MFWPRAADLTGKGAWELLERAEYETDALKHAWIAEKVPLVTVFLMVEGWGQPPSWQEAIGNWSRVTRFVRLRELIKAMEGKLGDQFWHICAAESVEADDVWGFLNIQRVINSSSIPLEELTFSSLSSV